MIKDDHHQGKERGTGDMISAEMRIQEDAEKIEGQFDHFHANLNFIMQVLLFL